MANEASRGVYLRPRGGDGHARVTFIELFFDLVFVFAITQLSHTLAHHFDLLGGLQTTIMMMAVWWAWVYTCWITNWLDPQTTPVRIMLLVLMLAGLLLSTSIPHAFESRGLAFAGGYVAMHLGRTGFMLWAVRNNPPLRLNFERIISWLLVSGVIWIAGAFVEGWARLALWTMAIALDYVSPAVGFWTPFLGRSTIRDWTVDGGHMSERAALFIIIGLGESILVTGANFADAPWTIATVMAFGVAFIGSVAMWWIYFDTGAERGTHAIVGATNPGQLGRSAYTYCHVLIVAGIILTAVGDEALLAHGAHRADGKTIVSVVGGPLLYLIGTMLFKRIMVGRLPLSHLVGLLLFVILIGVASLTTVLWAGIGSTAALIVVAVWETRSLRPRRRATAEHAAHQ